MASTILCLTDNDKVQQRREQEKIIDETKKP